MHYLPHTPEDIAEMLTASGARSLDDFFAVIPPECRRSRPMVLPEPLTEWELNTHVDALAGRMAVAPEYKVFLGAGNYEHFIPAAVSFVTSRSEFVTSYTPYQPEMSQGTLQAVFEYQTLASRLLGLEVANASMYDGASALAEALLMAVRITRRSAVAVSRAVHPLYRRVVRTYLDPTGIRVAEVPSGRDGATDPAALGNLQELAAVAVQSPNFFGCIEKLKVFADRAHGAGALLVAGFSEPLAFGLFKNPGSLGADIACGEGQSVGIPRSFGGPGLGMFASKMQYARNMPGRLVGETTDIEGRRGFVLTLATRERHIRREKATSNICTNNSLCALTAAAYMTSLGGSGMRELAQLNHDKAEYLKAQLRAAGESLSFSAPGADIVARYRVLDNEPQNPAALIDLGTTSSGVPVQVHHAAVKVDLLIATGIVEPHQYAGYSGGSKTLAVGAAGEDRIAYTHGPAFVDHPGTRLGRVDGNPFHEAVTEGARRAGLRFILNVVLDRDKRILRVQAGDPVLAFRDLVTFARSIYEVPISDQVDIAIGGVGFPKDTNLYQASRAPSYLFFAPVPVVRKGGYLIIPARCEEGAGDGPILIVINRVSAISNLWDKGFIEIGSFDRKILSQRMPLKAIPQHDSSQIGMVLEGDPQEIISFPLIPVGHLPDRFNTHNRFGLSHACFQSQSLIRLYGAKVINHLKTGSLRKMVQTTEVREQVILKIRI